MTDERKISDDELVEISGGADGGDVNLEDRKPSFGGTLGSSDSGELPPSGGPGSPPDEGPLGTEGDGSGGSQDLG
jgi:hypothetical protein